MDEMKLLLEARPEPVEPDLSRARARLLAEISAERRPKRNRFASAAIGLSLAAAVAAAVVLVPWDKVTGGKPTSAAADPRVVLTQAADYARQQPFVVPRPDQFVFVEPGTWFSVDGKHDGLVVNEAGRSVLPGCNHGQARIDMANNPALIGTFQPCQVDPAYLPDLPTTVDGMVAYLNTQGLGPDDPASTNRIAKYAADLLIQKWIKPAAKAALFEAAERIPGVSVVADAQDYDGHHGIGIAWTSPGDTGPDTLVFDRTTHAFLGLLTIGMKGERGGLYSGGPIGIVDRVGQIPR